MAEQPAATALLNATVEVGEKLYPSTSAEGREAVRAQLEELQALSEQLFDTIAGAERALQDRISRWSGLEESSDSLRRWLAESEALLAGEMRLHATLDEKRAQLQTYRGVLQDAQQHHQQLAHHRDRADALREHSDQRAIDLQLNALTTQHANILQRAQVRKCITVGRAAAVDLSRQQICASMTIQTDRSLLPGHAAACRSVGQERASAAKTLGVFRPSESSNSARVERLSRPRD